MGVRTREVACTAKSRCERDEWQLAVTLWFRQDVWYADVTNKSTGELISADLVRREEGRGIRETSGLPGLRPRVGKRKRPATHAAAFPAFPHALPLSTSL